MGKRNEKYIDMIVYMSNMNENMCIPIPLTFYPCLAVGNDLINKYVRSLKDLICFKSIYEFIGS